jgi:hypothetical protein
MSTQTTSTTTYKTTTVDRKIIPKDVKSQSISNWTENILYARSRNVVIKAERLKPLTKHYAFFDGVSVDQYITSKFIEINMISGVFQVGELVQSDPLFTSSRFSFRLCTPNHYDGPYNNPTKVFNNNIVSFPLAQTYGLTQTSYSASSRSLNIDLYSLANPSEVTFSGYARPTMRLIGASSGAIAEVVGSILVTDEAGFFTASFFIPDASVQTNPKFINGTNNLTLTNIANVTDSNYLSFAESKYYSSGTTNVTDINNITTRNYTIIPAKTINETIITNTRSNVIQQVSSSSSSSSRPSSPSTNVRPSTTTSTPPRYEGVATGYIPATGGFGTVNQNTGGADPSEGGAARPQNEIGAAGVARALSDGYTVAQVQDWVNRTGAVVGPLATQQYGLTGKSS